MFPSAIKSLCVPQALPAHPPSLTTRMSDSFSWRVPRAKAPNVPGSRHCRQSNCKFRAEQGRGSCCRRCFGTRGFRHGRNCTGAAEQVTQGLTQPEQFSTIDASSSASAGSMCILCVDRLQEYAFQACGHVAVCGTCHKRLLLNPDPTCPVCRTRISIPSLRIYRT